MFYGRFLFVSEKALLLLFYFGWKGKEFCLFYYLVIISGGPHRRPTEAVGRGGEALYCILIIYFIRVYFSY